MPTNEERREVARKLRKQAEKLGPNMDAHEFANYTADVLDVDCRLTWHEMELRLAYLIEPEPERTCHPVLMDWTGNPPYYTGGVSLDAMTMGCSECGCPWRSGVGNMPNYCPNCGAKVVDE